MGADRDPPGQQGERRRSGRRDFRRPTGQRISCTRNDDTRGKDAARRPQAFLAWQQERTAWSGRELNGECIVMLSQQPRIGKPVATRPDPEGRRPVRLSQRSGGIGSSVPSSGASRGGRRPRALHPRRGAPLTISAYRSTIQTAHVVRQSDNGCRTTTRSTPRSSSRALPSSSRLSWLALLAPSGTGVTLDRRRPVSPRHRPVTGMTVPPSSSSVRPHVAGQLGREMIA